MAALVLAISCGGRDSQPTTREASADPISRGSVASVAGASPSDGLRLGISDSGPVLVLPPAMRAALQAYAPRFRPWRLEEYAPRVREDLGPYFGAAGDFNGDGVRDVALQGRDDENEFFIVLLSAEGAGFRVVEIRGRRPLNPRGHGSYLRPVGPGQLEVPEGIEAFSGPPPLLTTDAFEEIHVEGAGVLFYWKDGRFHEYITGD